MSSDRGRDDLPFLQALDASQQQALRDLALPRTYEADGTIFRAGDRSDHVVIVTAGRVKVAALRPGVGELVLALRGPGDVLGELSAIDGRPRSADAVAIDQVRTLTLPNADFKGFLRGHPGAAFALLETLAHRLRAADRREVEFGESDAVSRVAKGLRSLVGEVGEPAGPWTMVPLTDQELAARLHTSVAEVANALQLLEEDGTVEAHRRGVTIIDEAELERRAGR